MLTRPQQILLKRAQAEAGLEDAEYRDALEAVSGIAGCRSSTDARLTDRHVDLFLAFMEAIYWRQVDSAPAFVARSLPSKRVFRERGYWASKNPKQNTSRDRFTSAGLADQVAGLEGELAKRGFGLAYCRAIQNRIQPFSMFAYKAALARTLASKRRQSQLTADNLPF